MGFRGAFEKVVLETWATAREFAKTMRAAFDMVRDTTAGAYGLAEYNGSEEFGTGVLKHVGVNNVYYQDGVTTRKVLGDRHWPLL